MTENKIYRTENSTTVVNRLPETLDKHECGISAHLAFRWHVVHLRVQQHGTSTEWDSLIGYRSGCSAVNSQHFLFTGDDQLLLKGTEETEKS